MMNQFCKRVLLSFAAMLFVVSATAQVTTSTLNGKVSDTEGEPVVGATVVAVHTPSGSQYYAVANADGRYFINGMRSGGPYTVEVSCLGYNTVTYTDITLSLAEAYALNATLSDDTQLLSEAIVISSASSRFSAVEKTGAATNINSRQMLEMPTVSRSLTDVAKLSPYGGNGMNFSGSSGRSTNFTLDGANVNNNFGLSASLPGGGNPISLEAIEEMQIVISPFDVRQSNFIGGGINAITKSGTNTLKGSAYVYHQNENLHGSRIDGVDLERTRDRETTYGFTLGGPIVKNKLFFFVSGEILPSTSDINKWRTSADGVADPDRQITRVSTSEAETMRNFLIRNYDYDPGAFDNYNKSNNTVKALARIDWNINDSHKLALRYNYTSSNLWKLPSTSRDVSGMTFDMASQYGLVYANSMYNQKNNVYTISADLNSRLSDNVSNQFLVTYSNIQDVRGNDGGFFPFVEILAGDLGEGHEMEPYMDFGTELFTYRNNVQNTILNIKDDVTWYAGDHKVTAGASFEAQMALNTYMRNGTGMFRFASMSDFLNGNSPVEMAFDWGFDGDEFPSAKVRFNTVGVYAQDEWSVNDKLKLTYGLRIDNIWFNNSDVMTNNNTLAIDYGGRHVDTGKWPKTNFQFSPRIGFSYDVFGNKVLKIRGGTGLFSGRLPLVFFTNMPTNAGIVKGRATKVKDASILAAMMQNGRLVTDRWQILNILNGIDAKNYPTTITPESAPAPSEVAGVDYNFKMPQVWKTSIAFDWNVPVSFPFTITGEYIFNKTVQGVMLSNYAIPADNAGWGTFNGADQRHIYPSSYKYNKVDAYVLSNTSKGYGSIATISLNATPVERLNITAAYTHTVSKEITGMPGSNASAAWKYIPSVDGPNYNVLHNSSYNLPDRVMASVSYTDLSHNHFSLLYEGLRYAGNSYIYSNDMNGDGNAYDLIYIPRDETEIRFASADDANRYWAFAAQDSYLSSHKGQYAEAYAITQPFRHVFDFRYAHDFVVKLGNTVNTLQLSLDIQNVGNLFNSRWGVAQAWNPDVPHDTNGNAKILKYERTDPDGVPVFSTTVGENVPTWDFSHTLSNCWYMQIGIKYMFN
ncbi:MAG: TonB-dependent receptor [Bacteroidales bacterium]|nr:TonB-dependent receptor [Bacteroidales bacterium]